MADGVKFDGFAEFRADLNRLASRDAKRIMRQALRAGAKITAARTRALAPVSARRAGDVLPAGTLRKNIKVRAGKRTRASVVRVNVNVGYGLAPFVEQYGADWFYPAYVEYGHLIGKRSEGVKAIQGWRKFKSIEGRTVSLRRLDMAGDFLTKQEASTAHYEQRFTGLGRTFVQRDYAIARQSEAVKKQIANAARVLAMKAGRTHDEAGTFFEADVKARLAHYETRTHRTAPRQFMKEGFQQTESQAWSAIQEKTRSLLMSYWYNHTPIADIGDGVIG